MSVLSSNMKARLSGAAKIAVERGPFEERDDRPVSLTPEGKVRINYGSVPPFELPKEQAMKYALLILKECGCDIKFD